MADSIKINALDNVAVALKNLTCGETHLGVTLMEDVGQGHKFALEPIKRGEKIIKYGNPIGTATADIEVGRRVHTHNTVTNLTESDEYVYERALTDVVTDIEKLTVRVYERENGEIGVRNELWVIPTVGCVNSQAKAIVERFVKDCGADGIDGVFAHTHPYGCSQLGDDHERTRKILRQMILHPNAGGVLVLGLGCENNTVEGMKSLIGGAGGDRVRFLTCQTAGDEIEEGAAILKELYAVARCDKRVERGVDCLKIGLKCGGSDGLSGITANPLLGLFSDYLTFWDGTTALTEVPEMFGAERLLMARAADEGVFNKTVSLINDFKDYFTKSGVVVYENPSPGNKDGGITTLEDKSLGCTQKAGSSCVTDVVSEGESIKKKGLNLVNGPGNDIVAVTNLGAAGCHMVLFTTGRGTPLGGFVPTIKVATNDELFRHKPHWNDFNAGNVLTEGFSKPLNTFIDLVCRVASGEQTMNERRGSREIAIFKTGVTL